jgi:sugar lactone lactonase YvrE
MQVSGAIEKSVRSPNPIEGLTSSPQICSRDGISLIGWLGLELDRAQSSSPTCLKQNSIFRIVRRCTLVLVGAGLLGIAARTQEITSSSEVTYLGATSPNTTNLGTVAGQPALITLDNQGGILLADVTQGNLMRIPMLGGPATTILTGVSQITAVSADADGNIFVATHALDHLIRVMNGSGEVSNLGSGLKAPSSLTVDQMGNVIVADTGNNRIVGFAPSGKQTVLYSLRSPPTAVFADSRNSLYVGSSSGITAYWFNGQVSQIGQSWSNPTSITEAGNANLFVIDSGTHQLVEIVASTGKQQILAGSNDPRSVTSISGDHLGNLYAYDEAQAQIMKLDAQINLGSVQVGTQTAQYTLAYQFQSRDALASISALTQGSPDSQLAVVGGSCLTYYTYLKSDTCTVTIAATPAQTGSWNGDITLVDINGIDLLDTEIVATGLAPLQALLPGRAQTYYRNQYSYTGELIPSALAVDNAGNLYIGDDANARVLKVETNGNTEVAFTGSADHALGDPLALALDGKGDLIIADQSLAWGLSPTLGAPATLKSNVYYAIPYGQWGGGQAFVAFMTGLVVQTNGGFVFSDSGNNRVVAVDNTGAGVEVVPSSLLIGNSSQGLGYPLSLAYQTDGSLLIVDYDNDRIVKRTSGGVISEAVSPGEEIAGEPLEAPMGLVVDPAGNIYISDTGNDRVVGLTPQGYSWVILDSNSLIDGSIDVPLDNPQTLALDAQGNLFVADVGNERVLKVDRSTQTIIFDQTDIGSQSAVTQVTVQNIGNQDLAIQSVELSSPGGAFGLTPSTTCGAQTALAVDESCVLELQYSPTTMSNSNGELSVISNTQEMAGTHTIVNLVGFSTATVDHLRLMSLPAAVGAGSPCTYVIRAEDVQGGLVSGYRGTIQTTWSDKTAKPVTYTFSEADGGAHTFAGTILTQAGIATLVAQDIGNSSLSTNGKTNVYEGPAVALAGLSGSGQSTTVDQPFSQPLAISAQDSFGNLVGGATITFAAPTQGASATTDGTGNRSLQVVTDSTGMGYAFLVANEIPGNYGVTASLSPSVSALFSLSNLAIVPISPTGSFTISAKPSTTNFNNSGIATSVLSISPTGGFQGSIALTCAAPDDVTCVLSREEMDVSTIDTSGSTSTIAPIVVTIKLTGKDLAQTSRAWSSWQRISVLAVLFGIFNFPIAKKYKAAIRMYTLTLLLGAGCIAGCGGVVNGGPKIKAVLIKVIAQAMPVHSATVLQKSVSITVNSYVAPHGNPCSRSRLSCL